MDSLPIEFLLQNLGKRIREIRQSKQLRQINVVEKCGLNKGSYSKIESGQRYPTLHTLYKIAIALDEPISSFFNDEEFHQFVKEHIKTSK